MSASRTSPGVYIDSVGLVAPGLEGWPASQAILRGEIEYVPAALSAYSPQSLPPNERRRATPAVRLAFRAAEEVLADAATQNSVFASSDADTTVMDRLCSALAQPVRQVSPTDFHNSVHNAASGYWSIATASHTASTSLSGWDESFAAGLVEAVGFVHSEGGSTLLVAYDIVPPDPLRVLRGIEVAASVAMILSATQGQHSVARLGVVPAKGGAHASTARLETPMQAPELERLRLANPALRALPLLRLLALGAGGSVVIPAPGGSVLLVTVEVP